MAIQVNVNATEVRITNKDTINQGEYNINECQFIFSNEYDNLHKRAIFYNNNISKKYLVDIINDVCIIPEEVLNLAGRVYLCVYAYANNGDKLLLRYSPRRTSFDIKEGSYVKLTDKAIPPEAAEDLISKVEDLVNEIQTMLDNGDFDGVGIENIYFNADYTMTILLTDGTQYISPVLKGEPGTTDYNELINKPFIPSKTTDLTNDAGFITNAVNDLLNYYKKSETYNKNEIDEKISSVYRYKGSVATYADLPSTDLTIGDVYNVESDGSNYAWNGTTWDKLGGDIDLSAYYTSTQTDSLLAGKQNIIDASHKLSSNLVDDSESNNKFVTTTDKNNWNAKIDQVINKTYAELKTLKDNSQLVKGQLYRITDYVTTTALANTNSAGHQFDLIVEAVDINKLNNNAKAINHTGDTYYNTRNLDAWQIKYNIDNDTTKYDWADTTNGKGVIYYLKDEYNNECEYDHTNIRYKGSALYGYADIPASANIDGDAYYYTFAKGIDDMTFYSRVRDNIVFDETTGNGKIKKLPFNIMYCQVAAQIFGNIFKIEAYKNTIISTINTTGDHYITNNTFIRNAYQNILITGTDFAKNIFRDGAYNNKVIAAKTIKSNEFTKDINNNTLIANTDNLAWNTLNNSIHDNIITAGTYIRYNILQNSIYNNTITAGTFIVVNNFIDFIYDNTLTAATFIRDNTIQYNVNTNILTSTTDSIQNNNFTDYINNIEIVNLYFIGYNKYRNSRNLTFTNSTIEKGLILFTLERVRGISAESKFDLSNSNLVDVEVQKYMRPDAAGNIICTWVSDKDKITGIYKTGLDDTTWKTITSSYQLAITNDNKLNADLVDDSNSVNKFTTTSEKTTWNAKYDKPNTGIPKTDLASDVQTSLGKADTAIQTHQDISGKEDKSNKVTSLSSSSTDTQYPSAKCVYDLIGDIETALEALDVGGGVV